LGEEVQEEVSFNNILLLLRRMKKEGCGAVVKGKAVEKLWKSCGKAVEKLRKSCGKAAVS